MLVRVAASLTVVVCLALVLDPDPRANAQFTGALGGGFRVPPPPAQEVEGFLQRRNLKVRRRGAGFLDELGEKAKAIAPTIRKALNDPDPLVYVPAALWMAEHEPEHPGIIPLLMRSFDEDISSSWGKVVLAIKKLEPEQTAEVVRAILARINAPDLENPNPFSSVAPDSPFWDGVYALSLLGPAAQAAVPTLVARFEPSPGAFNGRLVYPLREIKGPVAELALARALKDAKDPRVRWDACEAMLALGPPTRDMALAMLEILKADTDGSIGWLCHSFKKVAEAFPEVLEPLANMLEKGWPRQRAQAASLLGTMGRDARLFVPALLRACHDDDWLVRRSVIHALLKIEPAPSAEVLEAYVNALEDTDRRVVVSALRGIEARSEDPDIRAAVVRLMKRDANHDVLGGIINALKPIPMLSVASHEGAVVREQVLRAVGSSLMDRPPSREVAASLMPFLTDADPAVRRAALWTLGSVADVSKASRMPYGQSRAQPMDLHWVGEEIVPQVVKLRDDPDGDVRRQVALTLRDLGSESERANPSAPAEHSPLTAASGQDSRGSGASDDPQPVSPRNRQDPEITPESIATLVAALTHEKNWESLSALRDLGKRSPLVEQSLIELIERESSRWRELEAALRVLSDVGSKACICPLVRSLRVWVSRNDKPISAIGETLIAIGPEPTDVVACLVQVGVDTDPVQSRVLSHVLQSLGPDVVDELVTLSTSVNVRKRQVSAWGLGLYGDVGQKGLDSLARLSLDADRQCRRVALGALGKVGHLPPAVVDGLLKTWFEQECPESFGDWTEQSGEYDYVRQALATCGNAVIERLIKVMEAGDHRTRLLAAEALSTTGCPEPLRPRLQRMAHDVDEDKRALTRQLLESLGIPLTPSNP
jgi:HEAT repeat protein